MSNVTIDIAGRLYTIACASGEEAHISALGASIDAKLAAMPNLGGQSEARLLLYAALLLADEAHEAANPTAKSGARAEKLDGELADSLEAVATRLESLATALESQPANA